jgi:uncharacterized protein HemX
MDKWDSFAFLTPEEMDAQAAASTLEQKQKQLEHQLAMADALRNRDTGGHTTGLGGMFGAIAAGINGFNGSRQVAQTQDAQERALREQQQANRGLIQALRRQWDYNNQQQQQPQQAQGMQAQQEQPAAYDPLNLNTVNPY